MRPKGKKMRNLQMTAALILCAAFHAGTVQASEIYPPNPDVRAYVFAVCSSAKGMRFQLQNVTEIADPQVIHMDFLRAGQAIALRQQLPFGEISYLSYETVKFDPGSPRCFDGLKKVDCTAYDPGKLPGHTFRPLMRPVDRFMPGKDTKIEMIRPRQQTAAQ